MSTPQHDSGEAKPGPATRGPELAVSAFLLLLSALVITDSLRVGIGWADDGPRSGYFPFYIGLLLMASSATVLISTLLRWRKPSPEFAERAQLATVFAMLVPMLIYVAAIALIGIYISSALLIGYFMRRYGKFGWPLVGTVSVAVPVIFFLVFERWFLVQLPKGPIEIWLGF